MPAPRETLANCRRVVAAIEVQRVDVGEESELGDRFEGGFEHADVVAVRAVDRPADRDAVTLPQRPTTSSPAWLDP